MPILELPQYDTEGNVLPHDHVGIQPDDGIIRRIPEYWVVDDEKAESGRRISSLALKASSGANGGMSIDLQQQIEKAGYDAKEYVTTPRWVGSILFIAKSLRNEGFQIGFDPMDDNPYHGQVWGRFSKANQKKLWKLCEWFVPIEGVSIGS